LIYGVDTTFLVQVEVMGHPGHSAARDLLDRLLTSGNSLALAPQVLAEFIHVVTDERRFARPLTVQQARDRAERWWTSVEAVAVFPNEHTVPMFLAWLREHHLGPKRLLDTLLAATYLANDISSIVTTNARDYRVFGTLSVVEPQRG
jgi:predicted nucleic acid-binding protein